MMLTSADFVLWLRTICCGGGFGLSQSCMSQDHSRGVFTIGKCVFVILFVHLNSSPTKHPDCVLQSIHFNDQALTNIFCNLMKEARKPATSPASTEKRLNSNFLH